MIPIELTESWNLIVRPIVPCYSLPKAWSIGTAPTFMVNWNQVGQQWTVPVGAAIAKIISIARQPISLSLSCYANVVHPTGGAPWLTRMVVTFMFPK